MGDSIGQTTADGSNAKFWLPYIVLFLLSAAILCYSQTSAMIWDEGFHLLAAFLVKSGKTPYVDFCFPQPALNAWWNAAWLRLFGESWRAVHAVTAALTCGAIWLTVSALPTRYRMAAALFAGLNATMIEFGTCGQAYGACLFLTAAAFRLAVYASERSRLSLTIASGLASGAAAGCSLLAAPACLVLLIRIALQKRWSRVIAFAAGVAVPLLPLLVLLIRAPYQTWFNLVGYHAFYRSMGWTGALRNDLEVLNSWVDSGQALLLGLFAVAGLVFTRRMQWARSLRLAAWMAAAIGAEACFAHPTFHQYFILVVPLLAVPAAAGFVEVGARLSLPPRWAIIGLAVLLCLGLANSIDDMSDEITWTTVEAVARKVDQLTPRNAGLLADPQIYFLTQRVPPSGMNFPASHRAEMPPGMASALHIVPQSELKRQVKARTFATVETCNNSNPEIQALELPKTYAQSTQVAGCYIYWSPK